MTKINTNAGKDTVNVLSTGAETAIDTGSESDTVNIRAIGAATTVNAGTGADTINVGSLAPAFGGLVDGVAGALVLDGGTGSDALNIDDTGDTTNNPGTLTASTLTGLGMAGGITYQSLETFGIGLGSGHDTFTVESTPAGAVTTLATNAGDDTLNVVSTGGVTKINTNAGKDTVNVLSTGAETAIDTGADADTINIRAIIAATTVNTGAGDDTINVGSLAPAIIGGVVDGVAGALVLDGGTGSDALNIDDTGDTTSNIGRLTASTLTGLGMAGGISYQSLETFGIGLGSGSDTFTVASTPAGAVTTLATNAGDDTVNVASTGGVTKINTNAGKDTVNVLSTGAETAIDTGTESDTVNIRAIIARTTVNTGADADTINVGSLSPVIGGVVDGVAGALVLDGGTGSDALNIDDTGDTTNNTGLLTASTLTGLGMAGGISYQSLEAFGIGLGSGNDTFNVESTPVGAVTTLATNAGDDTVNVASTGGVTKINTNAGKDTVNVLSTGAETSIDTGSESDTINVLSIAGPTTVNAGTGADTINVGSLAPATVGNVNAIGGLLTINGQGGTDTLNVDDTGDTLANNGTLSATELAGLGMAGKIVYGTLEALKIGLGSGSDTFAIASTHGGLTELNSNAGADTINVLSTAGPTTVNAGTGADTINVGSTAPSSGGNVNGIAAVLTINGQGGSDTLSVDDTGDTLANTGKLSATELAGLGMAGKIVYGTLEALKIGLGSGDDTLTVKSTHAGSTELNANGGADTVTLETVAGTTTVNTNAGKDTVNVLSTGAATTIDTGADADVVNVRSISATTTVNGGLGADRVHVGSLAPATGGNVNAIAATLTFNGQGGTDTLSVDDTGDTLANTGTLTSAELTGLGMAGRIVYGTVEALNVGLGGSDDMFTVLGTAAIAATTISGGSGNDTFTLGNNRITAGIAGAVSIDAGSGTDNRLIVDDSKSTLAGEVVFTASAITGLSGGTAAISYKATGGVFTNGALDDGILVRGSTAASTYAVRSTLEGSSTRLSTGAGGSGDLVTVGSTAPVAAGSVLAGIGGALSIGNVRGRTRLILDNGGDTAGRSLLLDTLAASGGVFGSLSGWSSGMVNPAAIRWTISNAAGRNEIDSALIRMGAGANTFTLKQVLPVGSGSPLAYTIAATADGDRVVVKTLSANATYDLQLINGTLVGPDAGMVWNLTGPDRGGMQGLALVFSGVRNLVGGLGRNVFLFNSPTASVSGNIDGGDGVNWLDYSPQAKSVKARLDTGVVSLVGGKVTNIDNFIGSAVGGDTVYGTDRGGVLVTHLKNNLIQAGSGRTILIGGNGLNTLIGNKGDDLILDGRTSYDADYAALERFRTVWLDAALTFEKRVALIVDPTEKAFLKAGTTLFLTPKGPVGASPRVLIGAGGRTVYFTTDARRIASFHAGTDRLVR